MFFASMTNGGAYFGVLHAIVIIFNDNNREKKEGREEGLKIHGTRTHVTHAKQNKRITLLNNMPIQSRMRDDLFKCFMLACVWAV